MNGKEFSFEEAANPTMPECKVIFEFGLADGENFNYVDEEEVQKLQAFLVREHVSTMDFFCVIRYYKNTGRRRLR